MVVVVCGPKFFNFECVAFSVWTGRKGVAPGEIRLEADVSGTPERTRPSKSLGQPKAFSFAELFYISGL